jgi:subfamily B ATP-binding cassette protein MsbA
VAFDTASRHRTEFHREYKTYLAKSIRLVRIDSIAKPISEVLVLVALFMALLPATYLVLAETTEIWGIKLASDRVDFATLSILYGMLAGMLDPCRKMSNVYSRLRKSAVSIERVFELIDQRPAIHDPAQPQPMPALARSLEFDNVSFTYPVKAGAPHRAPVLRRLSLTVAAGEVVAIVGQNGCGKSTLMNLLPRFYDPDAGEIRIDGVSLRGVRLRDLRSRIGIVTQDTILFEGTVRDNIAYGSPHASDLDIQRAADGAYVTPILQKLPLGLDSRIGEKGKELSGGQRQRIALARAMVRNPALLVLDEATSAADNESEALIHRALRDFARGRTVLMITHSMNPSLLEFVTRIVVLDEGQVLATGTHEELSQTCPLYRRLFQSDETARAAA